MDAWGKCCSAVKALTLTTCFVHYKCDYNCPNIYLGDCYISIYYFFISQPDSADFPNITLGERLYKMLNKIRQIEVIIEGGLFIHDHEMME